MTRGRPPKPTELKKLEGNPGKRPLNKREAKPDDTMPHCPDHLSEEAKREWKRMAARLRKVGLLTYVDRAALAMYCQAWGRWVKAEEELAKEDGGEVVTTDKGNLVQSPWLAIANRSMKQVQSLAAEFGMTPSARSRVKTTPQEHQSLADKLFASVKADND